MGKSIVYSAAIKASRQVPAARGQEKQAAVVLNNFIVSNCVQLCVSIGTITQYLQYLQYLQYKISDVHDGKQKS